MSELIGRIPSEIDERAADHERRPRSVKSAAPDRERQVMEIESRASPRRNSDNDHSPDGAPTANAAHEVKPCQDPGCRGDGRVCCGFSDRVASFADQVKVPARHGHNDVDRHCHGAIDLSSPQLGRGPRLPDFAQVLRLGHHQEHRKGMGPQGDLTANQRRHPPKGVSAVDSTTNWERKRK